MKKISLLSISTVTFMYPESAVNLRPDVQLIHTPFKPLHLQGVTSVFSTKELTLSIGGWCLLCWKSCGWCSVVWGF